MGVFSYKKWKNVPHLTAVRHRHVLKLYTSDIRNYFQQPHHDKSVLTCIKVGA